VLFNQLATRPSGPFRNRDHELGKIEAHVAQLAHEPEHLAVLEVKGPHGFGKTLLLREARRRVSHQATHVAWVSLVTEPSTTAVGPLRVVQRAIDIDCFLFEAALACYRAEAGQNPIVDGGGWADSPTLKGIDVGAAFAGLPLALSPAVGLFRSMGRDIRRSLRYCQEEFEAIEELREQPDVLLASLPRYLGLDIARRLDATGESLVVFYDAYDKQSAATIAGRSIWLRELIRTLGRGVHVIGTREPLDWPAEEWRDLIHPVRVAALPETDSRELVRSALVNVPSDVETRLLEASQRIPFLLQLLVDKYAVRAGEDGHVDIEDLPESPDATLEVMLDHLDDERRHIAVALCAVQVFDAGLFRHLIRELKLSIRDANFSAVASSSFVEDLQSGLYQSHDLFTEAARGSAQDSLLRESALDAATKYLQDRAAGAVLERPESLLETLLPMFGAVLTGWCSVEAMSPASASAFVDAAYLLYDAGYWRELMSMTPAEIPPGHPVGVIADFFRALATRRTVGVDRALEILDGFGSRGDALGRHSRSVEIEVAYLHELAGDYDRAREAFRSLSRRAVPFSPIDRIHLRSRMYHADMLIMDGKFQEASRLLVETYEAVGTDNKLEWAELVRCRARGFYCSFLLDGSADLLLQSVAVAAESRAMQAKLRTNLTECYCWHAPEAALEQALLSYELNAQVGNRIDMAKCDSAKGIALARRGDFEAAEATIASSAAEAQAAGYPGGVAFALQARAAAWALAGDEAEFRAAYRALDDAVVALGTYGHLRVGPAWLSGDDELFLEAAIDVDWLELDTLDTRLREYLGPLR
jgi:hypothetical protein